MKRIIGLATAAVLIAGCSANEKTSQARSAPTGTQSIAITMAFAPNPPRKGTETLIVTLRDGSGNPVKGATVKVDTTMPAMSMTGPSAVAKGNGDGTYTARLALQYATSWQFAVHANAAGKKSMARMSADIK